MARSDPAAYRFATIPGVGVLNATALVAAVAMAAHLAGVVTSLRGSGSCRVRQRPRVSQSYWASPSAAPSISGKSSSRALVQ